MRFRAAAAPLTALLVLAVAAPAVAAPGDRVLTASSTNAAVLDEPGVINVKLADGITSLVGVDLEPAFDVADGILSSWFTATTTPGTEDALVRTLSALPGVEIAERVPVRIPAYEPNDPRRGDQWHLDRVRATTGWNVERGNSKVRVGVIDTQFDLGHPELRGVLHGVDGRQGVSTYTDGCSSKTPYSEHGTLVAGVAAARTDNASGVASVGFGIGVVAAQAGTEINGMCAISGVWTTALVDMAEAGVPVVNLSFASPRTSMMERAAVRHATNLGTLVVAAAGNDGSTTPYYPAADPLVVGVGATDQRDARWSSSNHGPWVDIAAPGVSLLTLCPGGYCYASGTSTAAPVVAATATLLAARNPSLDGLELRSRILDNADAVSSRPIDPSLGYGRVRVDATLVDRAVRLYGRDRIATAAAVAREAHPASTDADRVVSRVVLVPADSPNNSGWTVTLPAAGLLADDDTAFVMTGRNELHPTAEAEIARLLDRDGTILIPGSTSTGVSQAVQAKLEAKYADVRRLGGATAAATAAALAEEILEEGNATAALVARGDTFADALSLSGPAAAKGYPLLFVGTDAVPTETCNFIFSNKDLKTLHLAGGTKAISPKVERELADCAKGLLPRSVSVTRDAGASRVDTAVAIAKRHFGSAPAAVSVANGYSWPDAVTGGTLAASHGAPVLTTSGAGALETSVKQYIANGRTSEAFVLGGAVVVGAQAEADVARMLR